MLHIIIFIIVMIIFTSEVDRPKESCSQLTITKLVNSSLCSTQVFARNLQTDIPRDVKRQRRLPPPVPLEEPEVQRDILSESLGMFIIPAPIK